MICTFVLHSLFLFKLKKSWKTSLSLGLSCTTCCCLGEYKVTRNIAYLAHSSNKRHFPFHHLSQPVVKKKHTCWVEFNSSLWRYTVHLSQECQWIMGKWKGGRTRPQWLYFVNCWIRKKHHSLPYSFIFIMNAGTVWIFLTAVVGNLNRCNKTTYLAEMLLITE